MSTMRAAVCPVHGGPEVVKIVDDIPKPTCGDKDVLVKVCASTVQTGDWRVRALEFPTGMKWIGKLMFGCTKLKQPILGTELSGVVEEVGTDVSSFSVGDPVICIMSANFGAHAEYVTVPESGKIFPKPDVLTFEEAAAVPFGGGTAYDFLVNKAHLKEGETVLMNGASGAVGTAVVQIASNLGAEVTAVCSSSNFDLMESLGAKHTIDYSETDFREQDIEYDIIVDIVGDLTFSNCKKSLKKGGRMLLISTGLSEMLRAPFTSMFGSKKAIFGVTSEDKKMFQKVLDLVADGQFKPVVDTAYDFEDISQAHEHVENRHKKGNVVVKISES